MAATPARQMDELIRSFVRDLRRILIDTLSPLEGAHPATNRLVSDLRTTLLETEGEERSPVSEREHACLLITATSIIPPTPDDRTPQVPATPEGDGHDEVDSTRPVKGDGAGEVARECEGGDRPSSSASPATRPEQGPLKSHPEVASERTAASTPPPIKVDWAAIEADNAYACMGGPNKPPRTSSPLPYGPAPPPPLPPKTQSYDIREREGYVARNPAHPPPPPPTTTVTVTAPGYGSKKTHKRRDQKRRQKERAWAGEMTPAPSFPVATAVAQYRPPPPPHQTPLQRSLSTGTHATHRPLPSPAQQLYFTPPPPQQQAIPAAPPLPPQQTAMYASPVYSTGAISTYHPVECVCEECGRYEVWG